MEEIAGNKSGIFKEGVPALAVVQEKSAKRGEVVLRERANELEVSDTMYDFARGVFVLIGHLDKYRLRHLSLSQYTQKSGKSSWVSFGLIFSCLACVQG